MKDNWSKKALKAYKGKGGNFKTISHCALKNAAELSTWYYPGIQSVVDKIKQKPAVQEKCCSIQRTFAVISTQESTHYPLVTAKAALLSQLTNANVIPLLLQPSSPKALPELIKTLSANFKGILFTGLSSVEKQLLKQEAPSTGPLLIFDQEAEAAAVVASVINAAKVLKKSPKKLPITLEGENDLAFAIARQLKEFSFEDLTALDERGVIYKKRPNMNRRKNELAELLNQKKDERERYEVLKETSIYISTDSNTLTTATTAKLNDRAIIITLKATKVEKKGKQTLISTLPAATNHISDLHLPAGLFQALSEGGSIVDDSQKKGTEALARVYKTPKLNKLIPGLIEKRLAIKIAKKLN